MLLHVHIRQIQSYYIIVFFLYQKSLKKVELIFLYNSNVKRFYYGYIFRRYMDNISTIRRKTLSNKHRRKPRPKCTIPPESVTVVETMRPNFVRKNNYKRKIILAVSITDK